MKIEIVIIDGESQKFAEFELKEKNPSFFTPYSLNINYMGTEIEVSAHDLFETFEEALNSLRDITKKDLKMEIKFHVYFESRLKSKSKARQLIDTKNFFLTLTLIPGADPHFGESEIIYSPQCKLEFADTTIEFQAEDVEHIFEKIYYKFKLTEEMRICLFCKYYDRFPGTSKHPIGGNSVCYYTERNFLKLHRKHRETFDTFFENLILLMLTEGPEIKTDDLDQKGEEEQQIIPEELTQNQAVINDGGHEIVIERILNLPRRLPFENCNYWDRIKEI